MGMKTWNKPQQNTTKRGMYDSRDVVDVNIGSSTVKSLVDN